MIENLLETCGLNKTERMVLACLIDRGGSIASVVAKHLNIKRPTVYAALEQLTRMDLAQKRKEDGVTYFHPTPPELIADILRKKARMKYSEVENAADLLKKALESHKKTELKHFQNITFESIEAIYAQLEDSLLGGNFSAIFNPQKAVHNTVTEQIVTHFLRETSKTRPHIREIVSPGPVTDWYKSKIKNPHHQLKIVSENESIVSDIILLNGTVILNDYDPGQAVGIKIAHQNYYNSMMAVFEMLWSRL